MTDILAYLVRHIYRLIDWLNQPTEWVHDWDLVAEPFGEEYDLEDMD